MSDAQKPVWFVDARHRDEPGNQLIWLPCHVIRGDEDITGVCYRVERFEDGTMRAWCYVKDDNGQFVLTEDKEDVLTEILTGPVELIPSTQPSSG